MIYSVNFGIDQDYLLAVSEIRVGLNAGDLLGVLFRRTDLLQQTNLAVVLNENRTARLSRLVQVHGGFVGAVLYENRIEDRARVLRRIVWLYVGLVVLQRAGLGHHHRVDLIAVAIEEV